MTGVLSYGLYFGICQNDVDPEGLNRIRATCPTVFGNHDTMTDWAWPCTPLGVPVTLPAPGSAVWIGFIGGDTDYPYWAGTWQGEGPSTAPTNIEGVGTAVPAQSTGLLSTGSYIIVDPDGTGAPGLGFKFSPNATPGSVAYPVYDHDGVFIGGIGPTGGMKIQGDRIQVTPNYFTGPWLGLDGLTNPPSIIMPNTEYDNGNRFWFFEGPPSLSWQWGLTQVGDLGYIQEIQRWITCTVSGENVSAGTWVSGFGLNPIGKQVAYDPVDASYTATIAVENVWYPAALTSGTAPTITLPDDGQIYKVEWACPYWISSVGDLQCTAALGTSTSAIYSFNVAIVNSFSEAFVSVVIPNVVGEGQVFSPYTNCGNGTPTITFGASPFSPSSISAYCVG